VSGFVKFGNKPWQRQTHLGSCSNWGHLNVPHPELAWGVGCVG